MQERDTLPVVVIGAGPIGLAAAAHLANRGERFLVLEAGAAVGAAVRAWGHVQVFSPWRYDVDPVARKMLAEAGWTEPDPDRLPTGRELVEQYLAPLAALPSLAPHLRLDTRVIAVSRAGVDKLATAGRERAPFELRVRTGAGGEATLLARAVIDASGTWSSPNPLGANGLPALGEADARDRLAAGIPDVLGADRARYAGRRVLVVGSGHSAFNVLLDLVTLAAPAPTAITWAVRRSEIGQMYGGGAADALPARGALGARLRDSVASGRVRLVTGFRVARVRRGADGVTVSALDGRDLGPFDEIVGATGFRPDLAMLAELRLGLDATVESPAALAALIDPNVHSCGTVPPHGAEELRHPEPDFYVVGMKSYGRAPTFLMLTGYEQVRSVVAALAGDLEAARRVELTLPETGVCSAAPTGTETACCTVTAEATAAGACCEDSLAAPAGTACCAPAPAETASACCAATPAVATTAGPIVLPLSSLTPGASLRDVVKEKYAAVARDASSCCGSTTPPRSPISSGLYGSETTDLPAEAVAASRGCGNPTALAELRPGQVVLDLGSGGGIDVLLSARRVAPGGKAYGLDMTDEMLALARENQQKAGVDNVEFLKGEIERIPLPDDTVDVIISNCVINLSADKDAVMAEAFRVLKPGGRLAVSDVVVRGEVPAAIRRSVELWIGCVAGALEESEYRARLEKAGFERVAVEPTRVYRAEDARDALARAGLPAEEIAPAIDGKFMSAFIRARKPGS
jgi:SAM-dependent methyltransferase/cation diffusion facilitator CzcD-associated flavoprotein CzcO